MLALKASVQWPNKLARVLLMVLRSDVGLMTDRICNFAFDNTWNYFLHANI